MNNFYQIKAFLSKCQFRKLFTLFILGMTFNGVAFAQCTVSDIPYVVPLNTAAMPDIPLCMSTESFSGNDWITADPLDYILSNTGYSSKVLVYVFDYINDEPADSWIYTNGLNLTGGTSYVLKYKYGKGGSTSVTEKMKIKYGSNPSASHMDSLLKDYPSITNATPNTDSVIFIPPSTGVYYIGFQAYSTSGQFVILLDSISVDVNCLEYTVDLGNDTSICSGATLVLDAENPDSDFLWSDGSTNQTLEIESEGSYFVTVNNESCIASDTIEITFTSEPTANNIEYVDNGDGSFAFSVNGAEDVEEYNWNFGDGNEGNGATVSHTFMESGNYEVILTISNDCGEDTIKTIVSSTVGIKILGASNEVFDIYPNPAANIIFIKNLNSFEINHIRIINVLGQTVYEGAQPIKEEYTLDISYLNSGLYTVYFQAEEGAIIRKMQVIK